MQGGRRAARFYFRWDLRTPPSCPPVLLSEPCHSYSQPGSVGHEREAVLQRHRDQSVGNRLLRSAETVQRRGAKVSVSNACRESFN